MRFTEPLARIVAAPLIALALAACAGKETPEALLAKARESIAAAQPKAAEIHLKNLLQQDDNNAEAHLLLAGLYRDANDHLWAEKEYRRARDLGVAADAVVPPLLESMLRLGLFKELIAEERGTALEDPDARARALTAVGRAQLRLAQPVESGRSFAAALAAKADHVPAQVDAATVQAVRSRAAARTSVDAILQRHPDSVDALLLKAELELADRKLAAARALYEKVADASPYDVETRAQLVSLALDLADTAGARQRHDELRKLAPLAPITHYLSAVIDARDRKLEPARDAVNEALRLAPDYLPAVSLAAALNLSLNSLEQAERQARMLVERMPNSPLGYRILGATYLRMNAPDRALDAVRPTLNRTPPDAVLLSIAGEASLKLSEPAAAAGYFERASKLRPEEARARTGLALSHLAIGEQARGIGELEQAVELDTDSLQADIALVMAHMRGQQFDRALAALARMELKAPKNPLPATLRGSVLSARGDEKGARAAYEQALQLDPTSFAAASGLAGLDLRDNRPDDARRRYEAVIAKDPKNAQAAVALATLTARTGGSREQVLAELRKAREANPGAVLPILATARFLIEGNAPKDAIPMLQGAANRNPESTAVLELLALAFVRSEQHAQAVSTWEKMLRIDPRAVEPQVGIAMALHQQGRKDEAMRIASRMRADDRQRLAGTILEGDLLAADGKWGDASERYRGAFAQHRTIAVGAKAHRALIAARRDDEAERFLQDWIRAEPSNLPLRLYAGETEIARRRWKPAFEHYAAVIDKEPKNPLALNNAAWALHELKDARALDHARRAYEAAPRSASILDTYGIVLLARSDRSGLEMLRKAVEAAPANPQIRLHLAQALAQADDKAGAKAQIDELLKTTPGGHYADAARALQGRL